MLEIFYVMLFCEWFVLRNKIKISSKFNFILKIFFCGIMNDILFNVFFCVNKNEYWMIYLEMDNKNIFYLV